MNMLKWHFKIVGQKLKHRIQELMSFNWKLKDQLVSAELSKDFYSFQRRSMHNVTVHEVLLGEAGKIFEKLIKGNQITFNDIQVLSFISIKISSCLWWDTVWCYQRYWICNSSKYAEAYIKPQRAFTQKINQELYSKVKDFSE